MTDIDDLEARIRSLEIMVQVLMEVRVRERPGFLEALSETLERVRVLGNVANDTPEEASFRTAVTGWMGTFIKDVVDHVSESHAQRKPENRD